MQIVPACLALAAATAMFGPAVPPTVTVKTFTFGPKVLEVTPGTTVTWTNADDIEHTVTAGDPEGPSGMFDRPLLKKGAVASVRFDSVGTWSYYCKRHSFMRGEVRVVSKGEK
ncbi:MAG TPA: plastocyanin/azurin family copper-binding protein [Gemmatimonadales bacterium]|nr:plastocyanin/azurin family copper-binding protein [Gemmatimonadales bacterium]